MASVTDLLDGFGKISMETFNPLIIEYKGKVIGEMRELDGFINATKMCKSGGKLWNDYYRLDTTKAFLAALSLNTNRNILELIDSKRGGNHSGTWVHPLVATHLAAWISPQFAAKISVWLETAKTTIPSIATEYAEAINNLTPHPKDQIETRIRDELSYKLNGKIEVLGTYGRIDIVTSEEVIEVKQALKFTHALGQVLGHSVSFPALRRRVHLFGTSEECSDERINNAVKLGELYNVVVTFEIILE